ncbi:MAG: ATP-binding protein [Spirochaetes bacterium]|nr:ATP-binding protein [Spirochaetota bacterium]
MKYYHRTLEKTLSQYLSIFPAVAVCGPRQSGKSTMLKQQYSHTYRYVTFDDPIIRERFLVDPKGFFKEFNNHIIFDEVQKVPDIFNYIKLCIDDNRFEYGNFILTGSSQFTMLKNITESLAGRIGLLTLLPFQYSEIPHLLQKHQIIYGSYPENVVRKYHGVHEWYAAYITNYLERDVRSLFNIGNLKDFQRLLSLLASQTAQELNMNRLANDIGVTVKTIKSWISVLEASYVLFTVLPYYNNIGKRIVKRPKVYFYDTGVVCYLTGIYTLELLQKGPLAGTIFENYIIAELNKIILHHNAHIKIFYLRDNTGNEIDCIIEDLRNKTIYLLEIKLTSTPKPLFAEKIAKLIQQFKNYNPHTHIQGTVLYQGKEDITIHNVRFTHYINFLKEFENLCSDNKSL